MDIKTLIDNAAKRGRKTQAELAKDMGKAPARLSEWIHLKGKPDVNDIADLANRAGLPVFETVAQIQTQLDPRYANIWKRAVSELRQNQG